MTQLRRTDRSPDSGPTIDHVLDHVRDDRGTRAAFVASLAVGLASAGWEPDRAGAELLAAADDDPSVLEAATARLLHRWASDPGIVVRAGSLLREARRLAGPTAAAAPIRVRPVLQPAEAEIS